MNDPVDKTKEGDDQESSSYRRRILEVLTLLESKKGIGSDDPAELRESVTEAIASLNVLLDPDGKVAKKYGNSEGIKYFGITPDAINFYVSDFETVISIEDIHFYDRATVEIDVEFVYDGKIRVIRLDTSNSKSEDFFKWNITKIAHEMGFESLQKENIKGMSINIDG